MTLGNAVHATFATLVFATTTNADSRLPRHHTNTFFETHGFAAYLRNRTVGDSLPPCLWDGNKPVVPQGHTHCSTGQQGGVAGSQISEQWSAGAFVQNLGRLFTDPFGARARSASRPATARNPAFDRATTLNEQGIVAYNARDYVTARAKFSAALREDPNDPVIRRNLANAWRAIAWQHQQTLNYVEAIRALRQAVTVDPTLTDLRQGLDALEQQYGRELAAAALRAREQTAAAAERERLRAFAARLADGVRAPADANPSGLGFMDPSAPLNRQAPNGDASVVDLRDILDPRLVVDPRVFSDNPTVEREQAALVQNPEAWYATAQQRVQDAVTENREWSEVLLRAIREGPSSSTARFANWATFNEVGFDPALDAALLSAVREAYPDLDPNADPRLLRAIAEAEITQFLTSRGNGERLYESALASDDLLTLFQRPPSARTPAEAALTQRIVEGLRLDAADPDDAPWGRDLLESFQKPASQRATADVLLGEAIVERIAAEEAQSNPPPAFIPLSGLNPGDVVLVAPASVQRDVAGAVSGGAIQAGDYLRRVATDFAEGGLSRAAATETQPASHALAFVGVVDGRMLFLNHNPGRPSEIVDYRQVLVEYGGRELFVARPQLPVDGRALWQAAQEHVDYGVVGDRVVCSERVGMALARATGASLTNDRLGPLDITPGDFLDRENNIGKHFVVTRLRITGVPKRN